MNIRCSFAFAHFERFESVRRFARLRDEKANVVPENGRLAIDKVARVLYRHRQLGHLLQHCPTRDCRVIRRAAANDADSPASSDFAQVTSNAA